MYILTITVEVSTSRNALILQTTTELLGCNKTTGDNTQNMHREKVDQRVILVVPAGIIDASGLYLRSD